MFALMKVGRRFSMVPKLISLSSSTIGLFSYSRVGRASSTSYLMISSSLSSSSIVMWFKVWYIISSSFSSLERFVIIIICIFPFHIASTLTTHLYCLFICKGILLWGSFEPSIKFGWWSSKCLSSFNLDYPSVVKTDVHFSTLPFFWVLILTKT